MSEDEAETKWCPHARCGPKEPDSIGSAVNRWLGREHLPVGTRCIASACMAWRWLPATELQFDPSDFRPEMMPPRRGYCGLAGAAQ